MMEMMEMKNSSIDVETEVAAKQTRKNDISEMLDDSLYIPKHKQNPIITKFKEHKLFVRKEDKKYKLICPWQHEHKNPTLAVAAYFEPDIVSPLGDFMCPDQACKSRNVSDLCFRFGISHKEARNKPTIRLRAGYLSEIVDLLEQELANSGRFYQRGKLIVNIFCDPHLNNKVSIQPTALQSIVRALSLLVNFENFEKRTGTWISCDPPDRHCRVLRDAEEYPHLPVLKGVAMQPYLRPDESLAVQSGYDQDTGFHGLFIGKSFDVCHAPSMHGAELACLELDNLLTEFTFKTAHDRSAALAAILTASIRLSLPHAPMFHCRAPQISSGKSYLTLLISLFATSSALSGIAFPGSDGDCEKLLLASLLTAPPVIAFDNLTSDVLPHKSLCSAMTEELLTGRILGVSKMATVSTRTLFLSNGNNVGPIRDMSRRAITINLDPACEVPAARAFERDPVEMVRARRDWYVSMALTIIRAWVVAGRPLTKVKNLATYNTWSDLCRQPLLWLGCPDPAESIFLSMHQDPDREVLGRLLHAWYNFFESRPATIREATSTDDHALTEVFMDVAGDRGGINKKMLGRWVGRNAYRIVDGLKFEKNSGTLSAEAWRVESV